MRVCELKRPRFQEQGRIARKSRIKLVGMAQTNQLGHQQQQQRQPPEQMSEAPFSLVRAIFTPFTGFSSASLPNDPNKSVSTALDEIPKLRLIIKNLHLQHAAVRQNMIFLTCQRADQLIAAARAELLSLGEGEATAGLGPESEIISERKRTREAIEEMLMGLRVRADGKKSEDFEVPMEAVRKSTAEALTFSSGSMIQNQGPRTVPVIRKQIDREIMQLIEYAVAELDAYDAHAKQTVQRYQESLDRRLVKEGQNEAVPVQRPGFGEGGSAPSSRRNSGAGIPVGILSNKHVKSPIDYEALKRM